MVPFGSGNGKLRIVVPLRLVAQSKIDGKVGLRLPLVLNEQPQLVLPVTVRLEIIGPEGLVEEPLNKAQGSARLEVLQRAKRYCHSVASRSSRHRI